MQALIQLLVRYYFVLLFVVLQIVALYITVTNNALKTDKTMGMFRVVMTYVDDRIASVSRYFSLGEENDRLNEQLALYKNIRREAFRANFVTPQLVVDSAYRQQYYFFAAKVVKNSIYNKHNYLMIDAGSRQGVKADMGIISTTNHSVVGIVRDVTDNFSSAISLLNTKLGVSAKIKDNGYIGSVTWDGINYNTAQLNEIPNHATINVGDTIVTSGYSMVFPEGLLVGYIKEFEKTPESSFYTIEIQLATDYKRLSSVVVVGNALHDEQLLLEEKQEQQADE